MPISKSTLITILQEYDRTLWHEKSLIGAKYINRLRDFCGRLNSTNPRNNARDAQLSAEQENELIIILFQDSAFLVSPSNISLERSVYLNILAKFAKTDIETIQQLITSLCLHKLLIKDGLQIIFRLATTCVDGVAKLLLALFQERYPSIGLEELEDICQKAVVYHNEYLHHGNNIAAILKAIGCKCHEQFLVFVNSYYTTERECQMYSSNEKAGFYITQRDLERICLRIGNTTDILNQIALIKAEPSFGFVPDDEHFVSLYDCINSVFESFDAHNESRIARQ
jgi:hypothetical protein